MTPDALAALHAACFPDAPWSAATFAQLLGKPTSRLFTRSDSFLLAQLIAPEAEILTLCVAPTARREGHATHLITKLTSDVDRIFLEVASDNAPARALYIKAGFRQTGLRKGYYARSTAPNADALTLSWP